MRREGERDLQWGAWRKGTIEIEENTASAHVLSFGLEFSFREMYHGGQAHIEAPYSSAFLGFCRHFPSPEGPSGFPEESQLFDDHTNNVQSILPIYRTGSKMQQQKVPKAEQSGSMRGDERDLRFAVFSARGIFRAIRPHLRKLDAAVPGRSLDLGIRRMF